MRPIKYKLHTCRSNASNALVLAFFPLVNALNGGENIGDNIIDSKTKFKFSCQVFESGSRKNPNFLLMPQVAENRSNWIALSCIIIFCIVFSWRWGQVQLANWLAQLL